MLILDHSFTVEKSRLYEEADPSILKNLPSESFAEIVWYSSKGDVYNLGLLLYQIEFGTHPFDNIEDETKLKESINSFEERFWTEETK